MLNEILKLKGVKVLTKNEQRKIGGGGSCIIKTHFMGFYKETEAYFEDNSAGANAFCVGLIGAGHADSCGYDCAHDGYGQ